MRDDFYEVIIERPRTGSDGTKFPKGYRRRLQRTDPEELPQREKMRTPRRHYAGEKSQTDLSGPMIRFLRSRVGRPWDEVYSEIRQANDSRSHIQNHATNHLLWMVERNTRIIDGEIYDSEGLRLRPYGRDSFYVHPETGILCLAKKESQKYQRPARDDRVVIDDLHQYRLLDGIWYEVAFEEISRDGTAYDIVLKKTVRLWRSKWGYFSEENSLRKSHGALIVAVSKRQLNKQEIRRLRRERKIA